MSALEVRANGAVEGCDHHPHAKYAVIGDTPAALQLTGAMSDTGPVRPSGRGFEAGSLAGLALVPSIPTAATFTADDIGSEVKPPLAWLVRQLQEALPALQHPASLAILLPTGPTMGDRDSALASAVCGGALSMARTWAIELQRDGIGVNCLMYEIGDSGLVDSAALAVQLQALWTAPSITGQQVFTGSGTDLGRLHP